MPTDDIDDKNMHKQCDRKEHPIKSSDNGKNVQRTWYTWPRKYKMHDMFEFTKKNIEEDIEVTKISMKMTPCIQKHNCGENLIAMNIFRLSIHKVSS